MADHAEDRKVHTGKSKSNSNHPRRQRNRRCCQAENEIESQPDMKALLLTKYRSLEIADFPAPEPGPDEVVIRVEACGICGSDVHGYDGSSGRRIPPIVMGHEAAGTVAAVGAGVTGYAAGDRVTFDSTVYCGACAWCQSGDVNL